MARKHEITLALDFPRPQEHISWLGIKQERRPSLPFMIRTNWKPSEREQQQKYLKSHQIINGIIDFLIWGHVDKRAQLVIMRTNLSQRVYNRSQKGRECMWLGVQIHAHDTPFQVEWTKQRWHTAFICLFSSHSLLQLRTSAFPQQCKAPIQHNAAILKMCTDEKKKKARVILWSFPVAGEQREGSRLGKKNSDGGRAGDAADEGNPSELVNCSKPR